MRPVLIWTYHRVLPGKIHGALTAAVFDEQLSFLRHAGYSFIDTAGLAEWFSGKLDRNAKYTMLTFDDGWADNLIWASPILKKHGAKAVIAINLSLINPLKREFMLEEFPEKYPLVNSKDALENAVYKRNYDSFLTWEELGRLQKYGIWDIQSHGASHFGVYKDLKKIEGFFPEKKHWTMEYALDGPPFSGAPKGRFASILSHPRTLLAPDLVDALKKCDTQVERMKICKKHQEPVRTVENDAEFIKRISEEFSFCRQILKDRLNVHSDCLFWPWGHYSAAGVKAALQCGYKMLFTMDKDAVTTETDETSIPRIAAPETLSRFRKQKKIFSSRALRSLRKIYVSIAKK